MELLIFFMMITNRPSIIDFAISLLHRPLHTLHSSVVKTHMNQSAWKLQIIFTMDINYGIMFNHTIGFKINKMLLNINHVFFFVFLALLGFFLHQTHASKYNKEIQLCKNGSINYDAIQLLSSIQIILWPRC